ncbi:response regulator transcription factor [Mariniplasma anaerobium]|uniref:DNA-binding response regulator n=1 Tax=Mariniplasma anaerobium TaxID=2735436 RepID=A0A7U9XV89_9MOLU|nr:response regulator [Mariniplasma anaerobium]BCR35917.1 DNA-binding response regulator [Mariniplasma anaerobium]
MNKTILLIEDETSLLEILVSYFKKEGFTVLTASNGLDGILSFKKHNVDFVCSDIMMPKVDGFEVAEKIREDSDVPIILLTALDTEEDQLKGYELQIDEYVTKPFSPLVLVMKVKAILQRIDSSHKQNGHILEFNQVSINIPAHTVTLDHQRLQLSKTEFDMLVFMGKNPNEVLSRADFLDEVWGMDVYVEERVVDTNIKMLRKKLNPYGDMIETIFKVGYKLNVQKY